MYIDDGHDTTLQIKNYSKDSVNITIYGKMSSDNLIGKDNFIKVLQILNKAGSKVIIEQFGEYLK